VKTFAMKRVTIVGEKALEPQLVKEMHDFGVTGYTSTVVHGGGAKGTRPSRWEGPNVKIEVIASPELAERILTHVAQNYFEKYAVIAFVDDVQVLRAEKFGG
jgi:nitrogen regulatory protein P-II 2